MSVGLEKVTLSDFIVSTNEEEFAKGVYIKE